MPPVGRDEATPCDSRRRSDIIAVVVANAGIGSTGVKLHPMAEPLWQATIDVNLSGVWKTVRAGVPHLLAGGRGGSIVLTSSVVGLKTYPQVGHYVAAKHGVVGLMRTFAVVLGQHSIRLNSVHPTHVDTPLLMNDATYRSFRPGLENPGPDDLSPICQTFHVLPIPWGTASTSAVRCSFLRPTKPATSPEYPCPSTRAAA